MCLESCYFRLDICATWTCIIVSNEITSRCAQSTLDILTFECPVAWHRFMMAAIITRGCLNFKRNCEKGKYIKFSWNNRTLHECIIKRRKYCEFFSEEQRIRLEQRFNLLMRESHNRWTSVLINLKFENSLNSTFLCCWETWTCNRAHSFYMKSIQYDT